MKNMLFITFSDLTKQNSGSEVRPRKILNELEKMDLNVDVLDGQGLIFKNKVRNAKIKELLKQLDEKKYDYCYIESMAGPISGHLDRVLLKELKKRGVKISYFFRDDYYRLGKAYLDNSLKTKALICYDWIFSKFSNRAIDKYVDIVYFPSHTMIKYFNFKNMDALPPASDLRVDEVSFDKEIKTGIYVGSVSQAYGTDHLLKLFDRLNKKGKYKLILITNNERFKNLYPEYVDREYLELVSASGEKLKEYYNRAKVAFLLKDKNLYNDLSVSVKIYEYMGFGKSIVVSDCIEQKKIIEEAACGEVISFEMSDEDIAKVEKVFNDDSLSQNSLDYIKRANTWRHRAEKIVRDLEGLK